jgi:hypothetical protein
VSRSRRRHAWAGIYNTYYWLDPYKHIATDIDGEFLVLAAEGRLARPEGMALSQPLPALRRAEKPTAPAAERDLPAVAWGSISSASETGIKAI